MTDLDATDPMLGDTTMASRAGSNDWWKHAPKLSRRKFQTDWSKLIHFVGRLHIAEEDVVCWLPYLVDDDLAVTYLRSYERENFATLDRAKAVLNGLVGIQSNYTYDDFFLRKWCPAETLAYFMCDLQNMASDLNLPEGAIKSQFLNGIPNNISRELRKELDDTHTLNHVLARAEKVQKFIKTSDT